MLKSHTCMWLSTSTRTSNSRSSATSRNNPFHHFSKPHTSTSTFTIRISICYKYSVQGSLQHTYILYIQKYCCF